MSASSLRLPRLVEADPSASEIMRMLTTDTMLLWDGGKIEVPLVRISDNISKALKNAYLAGRVVRGMEDAEARLMLEEKGLKLADRKNSVRRGQRISRLLILADDGAERFYRKTESLLRKYGPRLFAIRLNADAATLGEVVFGQGRVAKLLMLEHKEAVSAVLLAMVSQSK